MGGKRVPVKENDRMSGELLGFVGVGRMGGAMALRLLDAGYKLSIYDTHPDAVAPLVARGAQFAGSPREVASSAEIVLLSLPTPDVVRAVTLGADGVGQGSKVRMVIDLSTTGPGVAAIAARGLSERNITWVDAPVSGGIAGAKGGTLALMISGPREAYDQKVQPILKNFGKVFYTGEKPGMAQTAKLVNNLLAAAALVITSEGMAMGVKAGLDPRILLDIINVSSGRNSATQDKFPRSVLPGTFDFGFATGLSYKDVRLCLDEAEAMGIPMIMGAIVRQVLALTQAKYGADSDFTSIAKLSEEWAGVQIRG
jgi:3-hydroxyisobutyrate dehydrogenase-like beta-hydroxyacid dehydrogenase